MTTGRVEFANALRGPAALAVLVSHYVGTFYLDHAGTMAPMRVPPLSSIDKPALAPLLFPDVPFSWGPFGVGLFFLISGFVIPFSLQRYSPVAFLVARAVRILPVYGAGFLLGITALALFFSAMGQSFPFSPWHIAAHAVAGLRALIPFDRIDGVVWTIEVEIRFYIVCAIVSGLIARGRLSAFIVPVVLLSGGAVMALASTFGPVSLVQKALWKTVTVVALNGPFLIFMFIGVAMNYHHRGYVSARSLAGLIVCLMAAFCGGVAITPSPITTTSLVSYTTALAVFLLAYRFQGPWASARPLQFLASISYPLYAVHAVMGYVILWAMAASGFAPSVAILAASVVALTLSCGLHVFVEKPSQSLAQRIATRLSRSRMSSTRTGEGVLAS